MVSTDLTKRPHRRHTSLIMSNGQDVPANVTTWVLPTVPEDGFRTKIGASVVEEFIAGHTPTDVLRELVQNEFDAGGETISVVFGHSDLLVSGSGRPIDGKGWKRLDVVLGTGRVAGDKNHPAIEAKHNGIGSKNFGLRSLFLFGDRIFVRSAGTVAVLDLPQVGTQIVSDPGYKGERGVQICVPYRNAAFGKLAPFTPEREADTFDKMASGLLATLVKLALPGSRSGIRKLTIRSERGGRAWSWRQDAQPVQCKPSGIKAVRRVGSLTDEMAIGSKPITTTFEEIEFSRTVMIPTEFFAQAFPRYYRVGRDAVRVSVSLPIRRKRIDFSAMGHFFYPLMAPSSETGSAISVSGPFELDADRSALLSNDWNAWLTKQAADLVKMLLMEDWTQRFGPEAYLALNTTNSTAPFAKILGEYLRDAVCWPTAAEGQFVKANELIVPEKPELGGILSAGRHLASDFAKKEEVVNLVQACGAKPFTRNSLVRLRCAGKDENLLATKIKDEANFYYSDYAGALCQPDRQVAMSRALTAVWRQLSPQNRQDLKTAASTLAADGTLGRAKDLMVVSEELWDVCPAPLNTRLHQALINEKALASLCKPFDPNVWVKGAAARAVAGTIDEKERQTLYDYLKEGAQLNRQALSAVRRSPVVRNQRNEWVAPDGMVLLPRAQSRLLDKVIHMPAAEMAKNAKLIASLRLRNKLAGRDLVAFAGFLAEEPEKAEEFEALLKANLKLLSPTIIASLKPVPFLRAQSGLPAAPADLYLDNPINRICVGNTNRIVAGLNLPLYERLGCHRRPSVSIMLQTLDEARDQDEAPPKPEVFYPTLVQALKAEKRLLHGNDARPILWIGECYHAPQDVLVGPHVPSCFRITVPHLPGPATIAEAYQDLGAHSQPQDRHWVRLFSWGHERYGADEPVSVSVRRFLREAYKRRRYDGLPRGLPDTIRCLLGRDHKLYSLQDLREGRLLEDDFPPLSEALTAANASIGFADPSEDSRSFFCKLGLRRLTLLAGEPRLSVGTESKPPAWFPSQHAEQCLALIRRKDFCRALDLLSYAHQRENGEFRAISSDKLSRKLSAIERLTFVTGVEHTYTIGGKKVNVTTDAGALADRIVLRPMRSQFEFELTLTYALAEIAGAVRVSDARRLSLAIQPLFRCKTSEDMLSYLERQGLRPVAWKELEAPISEPPAPAETMRSPEENALQQMVHDLFARGRASDPGRALPANQGSENRSQTPESRQPTPKETPAFELPPLDAVETTVFQPSDHTIAVTPPNGGRGPIGGGSGSGSAWTPPSPYDVERDRKIGERGEEIVYRAELERLRQLGHAMPEQLVVWISKSDPGADHDILSIDEDGKPIWIEVKSTMGTDGRFHWSQREFEKALREGKRYVLWRVYEAHTSRPSAKPFRDPIGLLARSALHLEIRSLEGVVESKTFGCSAAST